MKRFLSIALAALLAIVARAATVELLQFNSPYLGSTENVTVITPDCAANPGVKLPVVYMLNGHGGDHLTWIYLRPDLTQLADKYGMIMVCPHGQDSWYWDSPVDSTMRFVADTKHDNMAGMRWLYGLLRCQHLCKKGSAGQEPSL